jgi:hypothetical protein
MGCSRRPNIQHDMSSHCAGIVAFAQPSESYELYRTLGKGDAASFGIWMSGSSHPGAWAAVRRLRLSVLCHTARVSEHAQGHGMEIARDLCNHDLMPVKVGVHNQCGGSGLYFCNGPDLHDRPQYVEAWGVTQGSLWSMGLSRVLPPWRPRRSQLADVARQ